jgi:raffinose/stachyose/melibiose transport system substrate-binding protein
MRKMKLLAVIVIIAAASSAAVYSGGNRDGGGKTILLMNSKFEIDEGLKAAAAYYEQQNPGIAINVVSALDSPGSPEMKARFAGGEAPDIFALQGGNQITVWETYLEDLSDQSWVSNIASAVYPCRTRSMMVFRSSSRPFSYR